MKSALLGLSNLACLACLACPAWASEPSFTPETHVFKIKATVHYRCYGGYGKEKPKDPLTHEICDNKDHDTTLFDEKLSIRVVAEPTPDGWQYVGSWDRKYTYKGRGFEFAMTLFKEKDPEHPRNDYSLRMVASDTGENRSHATLLTFRSPKDMNPTQIDYNSVGEPEITVDFSVQFTPP